MITYRVPEPSFDLEVVASTGNPSPAELAAAIAAIGRLLDEQRLAREASLWLRAGRAQGLRLGMLDYRDRFHRDDAWRLSPRFPLGGREYPGLHGRGDAR